MVFYTDRLATRHLPSPSSNWMVLSSPFSRQLQLKCGAPHIMAQRPAPYATPPKKNTTPPTGAIRTEDRRFCPSSRYPALRVRAPGCRGAPTLPINPFLPRCPFGLFYSIVHNSLNIGPIEKLPVTSVGALAQLFIMVSNLMIRPVLTEPREFKVDPSNSPN